MYRRGGIADLAATAGVLKIINHKSQIINPHAPT
jgi:hypothetical protein